MLADMVRTDSHQLRAVAADSAEAGGIKVVARTRKALIWERTRQVQRLRHQLREYFPAALELLGKAPDPARAAMTARPAQSSRGLGLVRRSTATSCRSTSGSAFVDADERPSRTSRPQSRTKIR
jgi:Transposase